MLHFIGIVWLGSPAHEKLTVEEQQGSHSLRLQDIAALFLRCENVEVFRCDCQHKHVYASVMVVTMARGYSMLLSSQNNCLSH